jgi:uncharacterized repeat protein (TIGR01451 family)
MNKLLLALLLLFSIGAQSQSCLPNGITFNSQAEVDNFSINYPGCTVIEGDVSISNNGISNLSGLGAVTSIQGTLSISSQGLTNLNGLQNLKHAQTLSIVSNNLLTHLDELSGLTDVEHLRIFGNANLLSLAGLQNLASLDTIEISFNQKLSAISGFSQLTNPRYVWISSNPLLSSLNGFSNVESLNSLTIHNCPEITSLNDWQNLKELGRLQLSEMPKLSNISALSNVSTLINLAVQYTGLSDMNGLNNLGAIEQYFLVGGNAALTSFSGLERLKSVGSNMSVANNPVLANMQGLDSLESVGRFLQIYNNNAITSLNGLDRLQTIGSLVPTPNDTLDGSLQIVSNPLLSNISGLENLLNVKRIRISLNPVLASCSIVPVCNLIASTPQYLNVSNNAPNCNTLDEIERNCGGMFVTVYVTTADGPVSNFMVQLSGNAQFSMRVTDSLGGAYFKFFALDTLSIDFPQLAPNHWMAEYSILTLTASNGADSVVMTALLIPFGQCPSVTTTLGLPSFFHGCLTSSEIEISNWNGGSDTAIGTKLAVVLPPVLELLASVPPFDSQIGNTLFFELGDMDPLKTEKILLTVKTSCDTVLLGQTLCIEAFTTLDNPCPTIAQEFSEIKLLAQCLGGDTVRFTIKNIGGAPTLAPHEYKIIKNETVQFSHTFDLAAQQSLSFDFPADGATWRMEATKFDNGAQTAVALENCGGLTPGLVNAFWHDHGSAEYDFDCRQVVNSFDPNLKSAVPTGVGLSQHTILANQSIRYTIDFQNTSNDTVYRVLIQDVLPEELNPASLRPLSSSHPYSWRVTGSNLEVLFSPIALPDSNTNEPASHGYFSFEIDQIPNLPDGTYFNNSASITFDFYPAIATNGVFHNIGKLLVAVDEPQAFEQQWKLLGNPVRDQAIFQTVQPIDGKKYFELYDGAGRLLRSVHFYGQEYIFQRDQLPNGVYFFRISAEKGRGFSGKMVVDF